MQSLKVSYARLVINAKLQYSDGLRLKLNILFNAASSSLSLSKLLY